MRVNLEELEFYINNTHNIKCDIINEGEDYDQITILVQDLTAQMQLDIEESISTFYESYTSPIPFVWDKQKYIDHNATVILTKDDIALNCRDVPFNEVTMHMFPRRSMEKMLKAKRVLYRIYTGVEDIPYMTKVLKDRNQYSVESLSINNRADRTPEEEARIRALFDH